MVLKPKLRVKKALHQRSEKDEALPKYTIMDVEDRWDDRIEDEIYFWPRVLWMDPGVVSGVAVLWFDPKAVFFGEVPIARQILAYSEVFLSGPENGTNGQINRYLRMRRALANEVLPTGEVVTAPGLATGIESFVPRQLNMDEGFLAPVRLRAGIELALSLTVPDISNVDDEGNPILGDGVPLFTQSPSDALSSFTNERLSILRMYTPGPDHINDAKRHTLLYLRKLKKRGIDEFKAIHGDNEVWWA